MKTLVVSCVALTVVIFGFALSLPSEDNIAHAIPHSVVMSADSALTWENMSHNQKKEFMHEVVMPEMRHVFTEFDSTKFGASMKCALCHGDGAKNGEFKMPNPKLLKLPNTPEGWQKLKAKDGKWLKFMGGVVKPEMAKLLQMPEYDMKTGKGFGCMNCHTSE